MDSFQFDFDTDSTLTNDTTSTNGDLDWSAFQSAPPTMSNSPFSPNWIAQQDDAVAPDNRTNFLANVNAPHDDGIYFEIEHFFNGLNQQQPLQNINIPIVDPTSTNLQPIQVNLQPNDNEINEFDTSQRIHQQSPVRHDRLNSCLPAPLVPRVSSARSQCYHKLPDHAVKLMQEWYNANLDDPYPRSPDKKRFITEGNITAQQCRSWFANRRQRLKHVKRNHPRASSSNSFSSSSSSTLTLPSQLSTSLSSSSRLQTIANQTRLTPPPPPPPPPLPPTTPPINTTPTPTTTTRTSATIEELTKNHEHCYYCQQSSHSTASSPIPLCFTSNSTSGTSTTPTTTLNVVINQQTIEQLIQNSLRKLLYPTVM